ncbi:MULTISPECIES: enoyl-CoA hydratase/isomerase family protein [unclassified Archaeoglobus]|jgi:enoyl-CoA hydratase/carnithine racemase|uniref:enoyl-CoA hydratase/isomerase family protein n=1 Tax=unclassified Archaeoglobus TaxID=2643606 RepID=UPI0025C5C87F|nr:MULTISPECIES: enoyl-CoA hydratase/isomerase family protein [unclassified Archaeoglobus]
MEKVKLILGEVARISLNRPEKKNALDTQLLTELREAVDQVKNSDARVLILTGEGDTFCAGLDRNLLMSFVDMDIRAFEEAVEFVQKLIYDLRTLEIPVIAAVQRYAIGGGMQLALTADIRIATPGTIFFLREPEFGIIPDMGALYILPRLVGDGVARDMVYTRRQLTAEEAKVIGLVNEIYEDLEKGIEEYTQKLLSVPVHTLREAKKQIEYGWGVSFKESLKSTKEAQLRCIRESLRIFKS